MDERIKSFINQLLCRIEDSLDDQYSSNSNYVISDILPDYNFNGNFYKGAERSIAYFIAKELENFLTGHQEIIVENFVLINEFGITLHHALSTEEVQLAQQEITIQQHTFQNPKSKKYQPDVFCSLKYDDTRIDAFIEFKVSSDFKYLQLAEDYLKFKYYTHGSSTNHTLIFSYMYFKENSNQLPTLLSPNQTTPEFQEISTILNASDINNETTTFLHIINPSSLTPEMIVEPTSPNPEIIKFLDSIASINENFEKITALGTVFSEIPDLESNVFFRNKDMLRQNVLLSKRVQSQYKSIKAIYNAIPTMYDSIELSDDSYINLNFFEPNQPNNIQIESFLAILKEHFNNQIHNETRDLQNNTNQAAFNITKKRSLWILIIIERFVEINDLDIDFEILLTANEQPGYEQLKTELNNHYRRAETISNLNSLALGLVFTITHLFNIVYEISEEGEIKNSKAESFDLKKKILQSIEGLKVITPVNNELNWNSEVDTLSKEILSYVAEHF